MIVDIEILGGYFHGRRKPAYVGPLEHAPISVLVPTGVVSCITSDYAAQLRKLLASELAVCDVVTATTTHYTLIVRRASPEVMRSGEVVT